MAILSFVTDYIFAQQPVQGKVRQTHIFELISKISIAFSRDTSPEQADPHGRNDLSVVLT